MIDYKICILNSQDNCQISLTFLIHFLPVLRRILVVVPALLPKIRKKKPIKPSRKRARNWAKCRLQK